jgi:single-stranded-DNA-specific exonuclease
MAEALEQHQEWADEKIGVLRLDSEATGIVGLVAGRLREMYWKPFVVLAQKGEELVGSCRSVDGFDVKRALDAVADELTKYGGHAQAAGLTIEPGRFQGFAERLRQHVRGVLDEGLLEPRLEVDEVVSLEELHWGLLEEVRRLEPFGAGNPAPVFMLEGCQVERARSMGKTGAHVRLEARGFPDFLDPVGFHLRGVADRCLGQGSAVDLAFQVSRNEWQGRAKLQLRLEDLRPPGARPA